MSRRRWSISIGLAAALSLPPVAAGADYQAAHPEPMRAVELVDPWADHGGSRVSVANSALIHDDTLDPWRAGATWLRVRSGLDAIRVIPAAHQPGRTLAPTVSSGLDVVASEPAAQSWIHQDIVDPWAGRAPRP